MAKSWRSHPVVLIALIVCCLDWMAFSAQPPTHDSGHGVTECGLGPEVCRAFDLLFPLDIHDSRWLKDAEYWVVGRVIPGPNDSLFYFALKKGFDGQVEVRVARTASRLWSALEHLGGRLADASTPELERSLGVRRYVVTSRECAGLKSLASAAARLKFRAMPPLGLVMDPTRYEVCFFATGGETCVLVDEPPLRHPLRLWVNSLNEVVGPAA